MLRQIIKTCGYALAIGIIGTTTLARAYGEPTHQKIVERAISTMAYADKAAALVTPPSDTALWNEYLAAVKAAPARLGGLQTEFHSAFFGAVDASGFKASCGYDTTVDWSKLNDMRIDQCPGVPPAPETYWKNECALTSAIPGSPYVLGNVLGWHAGAVDNHLDDTTLGPLAVSILIPGSNIARQYFNDAAQVVLENDPVILAAMLPFTLIMMWAYDMDWDWETYKKTSANVAINPDYYIPTVGHINSLGGLAEFVGMWHFIVPAGSEGDYNDMRGGMYTKSDELFPFMSAIDSLIIVATDAAGFVVDYNSSDGVDKYTPYDEGGKRDITYWAEEGVVDSEFSNVGSLGEYGWRKFLADPSSAEKFGYPLHALADAGAPHHLAGATGWGHAQFEAAMDGSLDGYYPLDNAQKNAAALLSGFELWKAFHGQQGWTVKQLIESSAARNWERHLSSWNYTVSYKNWAFKPDGTDIIWKWEDDADFRVEGTKLIIDTIGSEIAFMAMAAPSVVPAAAIPKCGLGQAYDFLLKRCATPPTLPPTPTPPTSDKLPLGSSCTAHSQCVTGWCDDYTVKCTFPPVT